MKKCFLISFVIGFLVGSVSTFISQANQDSSIEPASGVSAKIIAYNSYGDKVELVFSQGKLVRVSRR